MKEVRLVDFYVHWLPVGIKPSELNLLIPQPVSTLKPEVIIVVDNGIPTHNIFKQHHMFAFNLIDDFLRAENTLLAKNDPVRTLTLTDLPE